MDEWQVCVVVVIYDGPSQRDLLLSKVENCLKFREIAVWMMYNKLRIHLRYELKLAFAQLRSIGRDAIGPELPCFAHNNADVLRRFFHLASQIERRAKDQIRVRRPDLFGEACRELDLPDIEPVRHSFALFDGLVFDPDDPVGYLERLNIRRDYRVSEILIDETAILQK